MAEVVAAALSVVGLLVVGSVEAVVTAWACVAGADVVITSVGTALGDSGAEVEESVADVELAIADADGLAEGADPALAFPLRLSAYALTPLTRTMATVVVATTSIFCFCTGSPR